MRGAEGTKDSETEALERVLPETEDTRQFDTTSLHEEETTRDTTTSTTNPIYNIHHEIPTKQPTERVLPHQSQTPEQSEPDPKIQNS